MSSFSAIFVLLCILLPVWAVSDEDLPSRSEFLSPSQWEKAYLKEPVQFRLEGKTLEAHLSITHDPSNLYLLLVVYGDDFYLCKDADGKWAEDRLFIVLDENDDGLFTNGDEDRISVFPSEFDNPDKRHRVLYADQGDWYYESPERGWQRSQEKEWELEHIPDQFYTGGPDVKEVCFFQTGERVDGEVQDYVFEVKIPLNSRDPYDLQALPGSRIGIGIKYGNVRDGYAAFPSGPDPDVSARNFLRYCLEEKVQSVTVPKKEVPPTAVEPVQPQPDEAVAKPEEGPEGSDELPAPEKRELKFGELKAQKVELNGKVIKTTINHVSSFEQMEKGEYRAWCSFWDATWSSSGDWVMIPEEGKEFFQTLAKQNNWGGGGGRTVYFFVRDDQIEAAGARYRKDKGEYGW